MIRLLRRGLSGNEIKLIAMVAMFSDHFGKMFFPTVLPFQFFGRIAFPLFAYMIAEGCKYTRNRLRYFLLIFLLGCACSAVYFAVMRSLYQNILLTFSLSIACIFSIDAFLKKKRPLPALGMAAVILATLFLTLPLPELLDGFELDYGLYGVFLPVAFYYVKNKYAKLLPFCVLLFFRSIFLKGTHPFAFFALPFLLLYNGKRGKRKLKYLFYIFYPAHLVLLQAISYILSM